jgi:XRE family transcriptional regulator, regulator of sulfur utilization
MARINSADSTAFGAAVRAVRMERGYSQEVLAARAGIDRSYCGAIERGEFNVSFSMMLKLADGLKVPVHELVQRAEVRASAGR